MEITAPGYIGVKSAQLDQWSQMAKGLLGMQQVDRGGGMRTFRMDERKQRLIVDGSSDIGSSVMGCEVPTRAELNHLAGRLDDHGGRVTRDRRSRLFTLNSSF
jgi:dihydroxybiphenyl dioxygenase BphC-like protein